MEQPLQHSLIANPLDYRFPILNYITINSNQPTNTNNDTNTHDSLTEDLQEKFYQLIVKSYIPDNNNDFIPQTYQYINQHSYQTKLIQHSPQQNPNSTPQYQTIDIYLQENKFLDQQKLQNILRPNQIPTPEQHKLISTIQTLTTSKETELPFYLQIPYPAIPSTMNFFNWYLQTLTPRKFTIPHPDTLRYIVDTYLPPNLHPNYQAIQQEQYPNQKNFISINRAFWLDAFLEHLNSQQPDSQTQQQQIPNNTTIPPKDYNKILDDIDENYQIWRDPQIVEEVSRIKVLAEIYDTIIMPQELLDKTFYPIPPFHDFIALQELRNIYQQQPQQPAQTPQLQQPTQTPPQIQPTQTQQLTQPTQTIQAQLIYQYDKYTLDLIATYKTQIDASNTTWVLQWSIAKCISGKLKSAWWFIFTKTPLW